MHDYFDTSIETTQRGLPAIIRSPWEARRALRSSDVPATVLSQLHWRPAIGILNAFCDDKLTDIAHVRWALNSALWLDDLLASG
jgi:hypothetical protein